MALEGKEPVTNKCANSKLSHQRGAPHWWVNPSAKTASYEHRDYVRKKRLDLGLRQAKLAERLGVSESTVWNWEHGTKPVPEHQVRIRAWFGDRPECE